MHGMAVLDHGIQACSQPLGCTIAELWHIAGLRPRGIIQWLTPRPTAWPPCAGLHSAFAGRPQGHCFCQRPPVGRRLPAAAGSGAHRPRLDCPAGSAAACWQRAARRLWQRHSKGSRRGSFAQHFTGRGGRCARRLVRYRPHYAQQLRRWAAAQQQRDCGSGSAACLRLPALCRQRRRRAAWQQQRSTQPHGFTAALWQLQPGRPRGAACPVTGRRPHAPHWRAASRGGRCSAQGTVSGARGPRLRIAVRQPGALPWSQHSHRHWRSHSSRSSGDGARLCGPPRETPPLLAAQQLQPRSHRPQPPTAHHGRDVAGGGGAACPGRPGPPAPAAHSERASSAALAPSAAAWLGTGAARCSALAIVRPV